DHDEACSFVSRHSTSSITPNSMVQVQWTATLPARRSAKSSQRHRRVSCRSRLNCRSDALAPPDEPQRDRNRAQDDGDELRRRKQSANHESAVGVAPEELKSES